jgi:hypothetical protein
VFAPAVEEGGHEQHSMVGALADRLFKHATVRHYTTYVNGRGHTTSDERVPWEPGWQQLKLQAMTRYRSQMESSACAHHFEHIHEEYLTPTD